MQGLHVAAHSPQGWHLHLAPFLHYSSACLRGGSKLQPQCCRVTQYSSSKLACISGYHQCRQLIMQPLALVNRTRRRGGSCSIHSLPLQPLPRSRLRELSPPGLPGLAVCAGHKEGSRAVAAPRQLNLLTLLQLDRCCWVL